LTEIAAEPLRVATEELACLDGRIAPSVDTTIPATDDGLIRGDGAFEVVRVYAGRPFALSDHLDRMERSAGGLRLGEVPRERLEHETRELLDARGAGAFDGLLRIVLTRGGRRLLLTEPLPPIRDSLSLGFVTYAPSRILDGIKSLSYAGNMLASRIARERGHDEALLVTPHGRVLEGPTSSFFWVADDGELCTTPLEDHVLASITRARVLRLVEVRERSASTDEVLGAREAFLASTTREVQAVHAVEDRRYPAPGERTRAVQAALRAHIEEELSARVPAGPS
jgi:branched-subunit amino acid aminotransferase/4-amino-4-deoxychorismate lyase